MRFKVIRAEAERLVHEHGPVAALETVHEEMKQAARRIGAWIRTIPK